MIPTEHEAEFEHLRFSAAVSQSEVARLTADNARLQQRLDEIYAALVPEADTEVGKFARERPVEFIQAMREEREQRVAELERELYDQRFQSNRDATSAALKSSALRAENVRLREQLQRWLAVEKQIGPKDTIVGPNERRIAATETLLEGRDG